MVRTANGDSLFLLVLYCFSSCHYLISNWTPKSKKFKIEIETEKPLRSELSAAAKLNTSVAEIESPVSETAHCKRDWGTIFMQQAVAQIK